MKPMQYNEEEKNLIDRVHAVFPKVELDPEVAIGQIAFDEPKGIYFYGSCEAQDFEGLFRGVSFEEIVFLGEKDNSFFWPSKFKPLPWWEVPLNAMDNRADFEDLFRMNPYAKFYYLPWLMQVQIHCIALFRAAKERLAGSAVADGNLLNSLVVPGTVVDECWEAIHSLPQEFRNPMNRFEHCHLDDRDEFLVFLSFFDEAQKIAVSQFVHYCLNYPLIFQYEREYANENEMKRRLKSIWHFAG